MCKFGDSRVVGEASSMRSFFGVLAMGLTAGLVSFVQANPVSAAETGPLQPIGQWEIIPSDTECSVQRSYGGSATSTFLGIHESISAKSFELIVTGAGKGPPILRELPGSILRPHGNPIDRWGLHLVNTNGTRIDTFGLTSSEMSKVAAADRVTIRMNGGGIGDFALIGLADALRQLDECTVRLRHEWRVGEPDSAAGIKGPRGDVRTLFENKAMAWMRLGIRSGRVQFVVLVDETGKVAGCDVEEPSGAPFLEELGCDLVRREVRAEPARDRTGKAVKDSFSTPPVMLLGWWGGAR